MHTSGFTNAPVTRFLVIYLVASSLLVSLTDNRHYLFIEVERHLWGYRQFWRLLTWQAAYLNSPQVLFAAWTCYNLRVVERIWGSRKFASFIITTLPYTTLIPPLLLSLVLRPLSFGYIDLLPAGPTPIIFALFAQYYTIIPSTYRYTLHTDRPATSSSSSSSAASSSTPASSLSVTFTSKSLSYLLPIQLALSQLPGSLLSALVGFAVGFAWRNEALPGAGWRVPGWVVGEEKSAEQQRFEGLRRRLEDETVGGSRSSAREEEDGEQGRRRTLGGMVGDAVGGGS